MLFYAGIFPAVLFRAYGKEASKALSIVLAVKDQSGELSHTRMFNIVPSPTISRKNQTNDTMAKLSLDVRRAAMRWTWKSPGLVTSAERIEGKPGTHQAGILF